MSQPEIRQFTLRLPNELYQKAARVAKARGTSLNALARSGLEQITKQASFEKLCAEFEALAKQGDNDVEFAVPAFREVIGDD